MVCMALNTGVPPPVEVGDVVKVLEDGSTIVQSGEYTVVGVQGDECSVEKDGERINIPRDRLILTIRESRFGFSITHV